MRDLARLFLDDNAAARGGRGTQTFARGYMTAWNGTTRENTVTLDTATFENLAVVAPLDQYAASAFMLLAFPGNGANPIVLGRLYLSPAP